MTNHNEFSKSYSKWTQMYYCILNTIFEYCGTLLRNLRPSNCHKLYIYRKLFSQRCAVSQIPYQKIKFHIPCTVHIRMQVSERVFQNRNKNYKKKLSLNLYTDCVSVKNSTAINHHKHVLGVLCFL